MTAVLTVIAAVLIAFGVIFLLIGALGIWRFPDFYTRLHAAGVGDTLGALSMVAGMIILTGLKLLSLKILVVFLFIMLTGPLGTNLIMISEIRAENYLGYGKNRKEKPKEKTVIRPEKNKGGN